MELSGTINHVRISLEIDLLTKICSQTINLDSENHKNITGWLLVVSIYQTGVHIKTSN